MAAEEWPAYGGDPGGSRYSPLAQIHRGNVQQLQIAWTHRTGEAGAKEPAAAKAAFEATPLFINGIVYLSTPFNRVIALDAETGTERWRYDPKVDLSTAFPRSPREASHSGMIAKPERIRPAAEEFLKARLTHA
jgi:quinoprotein glucose dehydrogenase